MKISRKQLTNIIAESIVKQLKLEYEYNPNDDPYNDLIDIDVEVNGTFTLFVHATSEEQAKRMGIKIVDAINEYGAENTLKGDYEIPGVFADLDSYSDVELSPITYSDGGSDEYNKYQNENKKVNINFKKPTFEDNNDALYQIYINFEGILHNVEVNKNILDDADPIFNTTDALDDIKENYSIYEVYNLKCDLDSKIDIV